MKQLKEKKILICGLGKTGKSVLRYFKSQNISLYGFAKKLTDAERTELALEFPEAFFYSGELKEVLYQNDFELLVLSPGFSIYLPEIQEFHREGGEVIGDIQLWLQELKHSTEKIIAITGSNGKSTVTELVGFICQQCGLDTVVAGNIGLPVIEAYMQRDGEKADVWVLELSSFQLETIENLSANAATCLNVSDDHLDRYKDLLDYAAHKDKIFNGTKVQVLNKDDVFCAAMHRPNEKVKWVSINQFSDYWFNPNSSKQALMSEHEYLLSMTDLQLQGLHNTANVLVAVALCEAIGLARDKIITTIPTFKGLPHRIEKIGDISNITFIDDSKGTNVGATLAALHSAPGKISLILGGLGKGQDFLPLKEIIEEKVVKLCLIGQAAPTIAEVFIDSKIKPFFCNSLEEATRIAYQNIPENSWVLLSPACASMDMFRDYAHRSEVFIKAYKDLKHEIS